MTVPLTDPADWNEVIFQSSFYVGINLENILYGIELLLYFKTIHVILFNRRTRRKSDTFYALFSTVMLFFTTIYVATQAAFGQQMWVLNPNFPGGPSAYWQANTTDWCDVTGMTAVIPLQLMTDALMIHRCRVVWNSYRVIVIPVILWLVSLALGILMDWTSNKPGGDIFFGAASQFGLAYWSVSVFLHATLTCMICCHITQHGKRMEKHLGREHAVMYFAVTTMLVESVLPYTISGIAFLVMFGMNNPMSIAFNALYIMMMCISPQMLILRFIMGGTSESETSESNPPPSSTVRFSFGIASRSQGFDGTVEKAQLQMLSEIYLPDGRDKV